MSAWKSMRAVLAINQKRNRFKIAAREGAEERIGNYGVEWSVRGWLVGSICRSLCRSDGEHDGRRPPHC